MAVLLNSLPFLLLLLSASLHHFANGQLSVDPVELAVEKGDSAEITCAWEDSENSTKLEILRWFRFVTNTSGGSSQEVAVLMTNSSRVQIAGGVLTIENVTFADEGQYECRDNTGAEPAGTKLKVYNDPSYWTEWAIVIGLSAGLLLVLVVGLVLQAKRARRIQREREAKSRYRPYMTLAEEKQS